MKIQENEGGILLLRNFRIVDLTHSLNSKIPTWNGSCGYCLDIKKDYNEVFRVQKLKIHAGLGTHIDAPSHRFEGGGCVADIPLEQLIIPACVVDVSERAGSEYLVSLSDIVEYEKEHGIILPNTLVIVYTGWDRFWGDVDSYRNVDQHGQMHFPAISEEVAQLLLKREIVGVAIDTLSPDCLNPEFPVHKLILGAGKYIIENLANASLLPSKGSYVIALPLRAEGATEAPLRIIGLIP